MIMSNANGNAILNLTLKNIKILYSRLSLMQMPMLMLNLVLKKVRILYLTFDNSIDECYFKYYFVILLFFIMKPNKRSLC